MVKSGEVEEGKKGGKPSTVTVSERELNPDPSSVVVHTRSWSLGPSLFLSRGPMTPWGPSVGETHARGSKRQEVRGGP